MNKKTNVTLTVIYGAEMSSGKTLMAYGLYEGLKKRGYSVSLFHDLQNKQQSVKKIMEEYRQMNVEDKKDISVIITISGMPEKNILEMADYIVETKTRK